MSTITPLSAIPALGSSTSRQGGQKAAVPPAPAQGDILKALVIEARTSDRYILEIAGNRILASSQAALTPGQELQLQVISTSPQVELKIVSDLFSTLAGKSLVLLGNNLDLSTLFSTLQQGNPTLLSQLSSTSGNTLETFQPAKLTDIIGSSQGGELIRTLFNRLGVNFERLLAEGDKQQPTQTLKAALLEIAQLFKGSEKIAEQANRLLATLELYQLAQLQLSHERFLLFPLPLPFLEQGYLLIEQDKKKDHGNQETKDEANFSLHLSLSGLGNIRIVFFQDSEGLYIRFDLDSKEKAEFVSQFGDELKEAITSVQVVSLNFSDRAGDPAAELVRRLVPEEQTMLDTTV